MPKPQFSEDEERQIDLMVEARRRDRQAMEKELADKKPEPWDQKTERRKNERRKISAKDKDKDDDKPKRKGLFAA